MRTMIIPIFILAASTLAVLHFLSLELFLYWIFPWLDMPMHILGGSVVALGVFTANALSLPIPTRWLNLIPVVLIVIMVALAWEVFEIYIQASSYEGYVVDTLTDLVMGCLGGLIGYLVGSKLYKI